MFTLFKANILHRMYRLVAILALLLPILSEAIPFLPETNQDLILVNVTLNDIYHASCLPLKVPKYRLKSPYDFCIPLVNQIGDGNPDEVLDWLTAQKRWESPGVECEIVWQPRTYQKMEFSATRGQLYNAALRFEQCFHRWEETPAIYRGVIEVASDGAQSTLSYNLKWDADQTDVPLGPAHYDIERDIMHLSDT